MDRRSTRSGHVRRVDLLAPSWWPWHLLAVVLVGGFAALGIWQLDRHGQREAIVAVLEARRAARPVPFETVADALDEQAPTGAPADAREVQVNVVGTFMFEDGVTWRNRSFEGVPGHHVITPLRLASDPTRALLVDRGWVSYQDVDGVDQGSFSDVVVHVVGSLVPEADDPTGPLASLAPRDPVDGPFRSVARIDADRLQGQVKATLERFVLVAREVTLVGSPNDGSGAADQAEATGASVAPIPVPPEDLGPGPHLSYALQWFGFAAVVAVGYAALLRSRLRILSGIEHDPRKTPTSPSAR